MATQPFLSHDTGFLGLLGAGNWDTDVYTAVLVVNAHGTPDRAAETRYDHISGEECDDADYQQQNIVTTAPSVESTKVQFTHGKITFTADGSVSGRYLYYVKGTSGELAASDPILGHVDLTGAAEDGASTNAEFSFTPNATYGLFEIERTAAPA